MNLPEYLDLLRWESIKNDSSETCPAFGLLAIKGSEQRGRRTVLLGDKPSTTFYRDYAVNGPTAIPAGKYGRCTRMSGSLWIAFDDADGTPTNGEGWGPKPDQWEAALGYPGISVEGVKRDGELLVGRLSLIGTLLCKATATLGIGPTSTNYQILSGDPSSNADSGFTTLPEIHLGVPIDTDKLFIAHWLNNCWLGISWECNDA